MKKSNILMLALAFVAAAMFITACGDDAVMGCQDSEAENYNPEATEGGVDCVYAADKFIGDYVGTSVCTGGEALPVVASLSNDTLGFSISSAVGKGTNDVNVAIPIQGNPVTFAATASGNVVTVDALLPNLPFPFQLPTGDFITINVDVIATGTQTYDEATNSTTGPINVTINSVDGIPLLQIPAGGTIDQGTCVISGTKQ